jgi:hypothetical protein
MSAGDGNIESRRAERLGALLRATDAPVPAIAYPLERIARAARRRAAKRWSAAAAVLVLASAGLGVAPVRAWIVRAARAMWAAAAGRAPAAAAPAAPRAASSVSFTPSGRIFTVHVAGGQAAGTLTLESTAGTEASAAVTAGEGATLVVLPDGLRVDNQPGATASFVVRVPATARVIVSIGPAAPRVFAPSGPGQRWVLDLRGGP